jgi:hypothetical protein
MSDLAVIFLALTPFAIPLTFYLTLRAGREWFKDALEHVAKNARAGEPMDIAKRRLDIEVQRLGVEQQVAIAKMERERREAELRLAAQELQLDRIKREMSE